MSSDSERFTECRLPQAREYMYVEQLVERTPWTAEAIRSKIARNEFRQGTHYFKPNGPNGRPIFSWSAIVDYIENGCSKQPHNSDGIPMADGTVVDVEAE